MKKLLLLSSVFCVAFILQTKAQTIRKAADVTSGTIKNNRGRIIGGLAATNQVNYYATESMVQNFVLGGFNLTYEKLGLQDKLGLKFPMGFGIATNNYFGFSHEYSSTVTTLDWYEGSKHYASAYVFGEYDVKKIITAGISAGPALVYTRVVANEKNAVNPGMSASQIGAGLHLKEYVQKYILRNRAGQGTFFVRCGLEQFMMANAGYGGGFNLSIGF